MTKALAFAVTMTLSMTGIARAATPVPSPSPPPYILFGDVGDYRSLGIESGEGLGFFPLNVGRLQDLGGEVHHQVRYGVDERLTGAEVEVQEVGDTTWLRQEVELLTRGRVRTVREIDGNYVLSVMGPQEYYWISGGNKAVRVSGSSIQVSLPDSFVVAYLAELPSDLQAFEFDDAHESQFVREEIDRRFYYVDKSHARWQGEQDPDLRVPLVSFIDDSLAEVVRLRWEYYGGVSPEEWAESVLRDFQVRRPGAHPQLLNSGPEIEKRINELKAWWGAHRNDPVVLPTSTPGPQTTPSP